MWSFCRFLHFATARGELNFPSERSEVVASGVVADEQHIVFKYKQSALSVELLLIQELKATLSNKPTLSSNLG